MMEGGEFCSGRRRTRGRFGVRKRGPRWRERAVLVFFFGPGGGEQLWQWEIVGGDFGGLVFQRGARRERCKKTRMIGLGGDFGDFGLVWSFQSPLADDRPGFI